MNNGTYAVLKKYLVTIMAFLCYYRIYSLTLEIYTRFQNVII